MAAWVFFSGIAAGAAFLAGRLLLRVRQTEAAANASGLRPVADLTHIPEAMQRTALWSMSEGGFESRVVHGVLSAGAEDVDVTAFDLETLRERRGEWAYLPVEPPFRIAGRISIVVCEMDRAFPHTLLKREGRGDDMADDDILERGGHIAKLARDSVGMARSYAAEMPPSLDDKSLAVPLLAGWRAYSKDPLPLTELLSAGFNETLRNADRRDLVIELIDGLVIVYPAARDVVGADAFADLTSTALSIAKGVIARTPRVTPRGVEPQRPVTSA
jgi:hypothetical protein